jgi:hypothetical protein
MRVLYVAILMLVFGGVVMGFSFNSNVVSNNSDITSTNVSEHNVDNLRRIELHNEVGNVTLKPSSGSLLKMSSEKVLINGTPKLAEELFAKITITVRNDPDTVYIETSGRENMAEILEKYKNEINISKVIFSINYILEVPTNLEAFAVSTEVGNLILADLTGSYDLKTSTGNITLNHKMKVNGNSTFLTGVGNISIGLREVEATEEILVEVQTGNIDLSLANDLKCTLEIETFKGGTCTELHNGGGVKINAKSGVGNVNYGFFHD